MTLTKDSRVRGRYLADASQVAIGEDYYDIIGESDEYIALFRAGRSIYRPGLGSEYEPARIFFCSILDRNSMFGERTGEIPIDLIIKLETPIRRR